MSALAITGIVILIALGSSLQVVTGVGLGLIAGPPLLFFLDSVSAIPIAIVLNLLLTLCLLLLVLFAMGVSLLIKGVTDVV